MNSVQELRRFPACGVELDLGGSVATRCREAADDVRTAVLAAIRDHHVVFIPGQDLDVADLARLVATLGYLNETLYEDGEEGYPGFVRVIRSPEDDGETPYGWHWHSDWSFLSYPPQYSLLYAIEVPSVGGDTMWSNQVEAFSRLSEPLKSMLRQQRAYHAPFDPTGSRGRHGLLAGRPSVISPVVAGSDIFVDHPVVLAADDGGESLYVNESYTVGLVGWRDWECQGLLQSLYRWQTLDDFVCRYTWSRGTVAIWDNRAVIHRALDDCRGARREFLRATFRTRH